MFKEKVSFIMGLIIITLNRVLGYISTNIYLFLTGDILNNSEIIEIAFRATYIIIGFLVICFSILKWVLKEIEIKYNDK